MKTGMKLIAGLGNPTKEYDGTRHNIGFMAIDALAEEYGIRVDTLKHKAMTGSGYIGGQKVILAKPVTYMNLSGEAVRAISDYYKIPAEDILIIFDDTTLDVGRMRIRKKGSAGGHNGIKSIIAHLGTTEFPRVKIGIGAKREGQDLADYVLSRFPKEDKEALKEVLEDTKNAVELIVQDDIEEAMNRYNKKKAE
jgi:PTH1 family peptidyl-tRNA hydrolase